MNKKEGWTLWRYFPRRWRGMAVKCLIKSHQMYKWHGLKQAEQQLSESLNIWPGSIIQIRKQLTGIECLSSIYHGGHHKIMTSKGPSRALLRHQVLLANVQETHRVCWTMKIQMVGSRWVMIAMLFPFKCTQLPHVDQIPSTNQVWDNPDTWVDGHCL